MSSAGSFSQEIKQYPLCVDSTEGIRRVANNKKLFDKLLWRIANELPSDLANMQEALNANDIQKINELAHTLKGSSSNLSIKTIENKSCALEAAARANDMQAIKQAFTELQEVGNAYIEAMKNTA